MANRTINIEQNPVQIRKQVVWAGYQAEAHLVENVGSVGACEDHDALGGGKAIHFYQKLVQSVLTLVVAACETAATTRASDRINLICMPLKLVNI